jgi:hypothetical protein
VTEKEQEVVVVPLLAHESTFVGLGSGGDRSARRVPRSTVAEAIPVQRMRNAAAIAAIRFMEG